MNLFFKISCVLSFTFCFFSCDNKKQINNQTTNDFVPLTWIEGNYVLSSPYGTYYENWQRTDSANYTGFGYYLGKTNSDTLFCQTLHFEKKNDASFMYFNVKNQNNNKTVEFKLTKEENNVFTFENAFRDYPSLIIYKIVNDTAVNIIMTGFKDGEQKKEDFVISKLN